MAIHTTLRGPLPAAAPGPNRRRALQQVFALGAGLLAGCGGGGSSTAPPAPATAPPAPATPLSRLRSALQRPALSVPPQFLVDVSQGTPQSATSSFGATAQVFPPLATSATGSLASVPQVWGWRRDLWDLRTNVVAISGYATTPVQLNHSRTSGNTLSCGGICAVHFVFDGRAFEILFALDAPQITLVVDGQYMAPQLITTSASGGVPGATLALHNTFTRIDFGSAATRHVSVYGVSPLGPCAIAIAAGDHIEPWDRSDEPSFAVMADSYGGAASPSWGTGGLFYEAAAQLGIPNVDRDAEGGTGYAPVNALPQTSDPINAFPARIAGLAARQPDLLLTAGGINDSAIFATPPLYPAAADAAAAFHSGVTDYYTDLRAALPDSVLVALAPWVPHASAPTAASAAAKIDAIQAALAAAGGPWVFIDNVNGGWRNSAGARGGVAGAWQTGSGTRAAPAGDGNGDLYLEADGVHPNVAGCQYLGSRIATDLRAALLAL